MDWVDLVLWACSLPFLFLCALVLVALCCGRDPQVDKAAREAHEKRLRETQEELERLIHRAADLTTPH